MILGTYEARYSTTLYTIVESSLIFLLLLLLALLLLAMKRRRKKKDQPQNAPPNRKKTFPFFSKYQSQWLKDESLLSPYLM